MPIKPALTSALTSPQLILLPGSFATSESKPYYESAYSLWHSVWSETLNELDGLPKLFSDGFTRQDVVVGLFLGTQCIALNCFRRSDLRNIAHRQDSWFLPWTESQLVELGEKYPNGLVNSYFTIHPDFRKSAPGNDFARQFLERFNLAIVLAELSALMTVKLNADGAFGVTRNNRSVNKLAYHGGAIPLAKNKMHHGVDVDLILYENDRVQRAMSNFTSQTLGLWENRIDFANFEFRKEKHYAKAS